MTLRVLPVEKRPMLLAVVDVFCGLMTVFLGLFVARCFGMAGTMWLPLVSLVWFAVHFARLNRVDEFTRASTGMLLGWWLYEYWTV